MSDLLSELQNTIFLITLNRIEKNNAFDAALLQRLHALIDDACANPFVKVIVIKANGQHFCAGADIDWMKQTAHFSAEENYEDALVLAKLMYTLHQSSKPTIAMVHGAAYGGGAGLVAACDIAIAANSARFCFSEVKLGLIPAVISPYVIEAIGQRAASALFMSAETFNAKRAFELNLVQHCVADEALLSFALNYANNMTQLAPNAVKEAKRLVREIAKRPIDDALVQHTARLIANKRTSPEGQLGLHAFLAKKNPKWE